MKNLIYLLFAMFAVTMVSCEKGGDDGPKKITVPSPEQLNQTVFADKTTANSGVTFTTTGAWTSSIAPGTGTRAAGAVDWVSLNPASGEVAGDYAISIILSLNITGVDRSAVIKINCGGEIITITVSQQGKTADNKIPTQKKVSQITLVNGYLKFDYDIENRVTKATSIGDHPNEIAYFDDKITVKKWYQIDGVGTTGSAFAEQNLYLPFNADKLVPFIKTTDDDMEARFEYSGGRISKYTYYEENKAGFGGIDENTCTATWSADGNLTALNCVTTNDKIPTLITSWKEEYKYGAQLNSTNLNLSTFILAKYLSAASLGGYASYLNNFGSRSKNLPVSAKYTHLPASDQSAKMDFSLYFDYTFDSEGYPVQIPIKRERVGSNGLLVKEEVDGLIISYAN